MTFATLLPQTPGTLFSRALRTLTTRTLCRVKYQRPWSIPRSASRIEHGTDRCFVDHAELADNCIRGLAEKILRDEVQSGAIGHDKAEAEWEAT